jgi:heme/copper-type cytochrome/quinol oxidase subunit 2
MAGPDSLYTMTTKRRSIGFLLMTAAASLVIVPAIARLTAQEPPNRRDINISARDYKFNPGRVEVTQDDLVKLTVRSEDVAYGFTIDQYRVSKRIPAGGSVTLEFRADTAGTYTYYSNMTNDQRHGSMKGDLVVKPK